MDISFSTILTWFKSAFVGILIWIKECLIWVFDIIFGKIVDGMIYIMDSIFTCCTSTVTHLTTAINYINGSSLAYVMSSLNVAFGLQLILGALVARFILRRIPLIG